MTGTLRIFAAVLGLTALALTGCDHFSESGGVRAASDAEKKAKAGDFKSAVKLYESALDGTPKTADVHYSLALLYADKLKSPLDAMHHFERYLVLAPAGTHVREAKAYRAEGEQKVIATLTKGNPLTQEEAARVKNENFLLRKQLADLRAQKAATPPPLPAGARKGDQVQKPIPPGSRTHLVTKGETLATIAKKYYKSSGRWRDIQEANFYPLDGTATIKPGMTLVIPGK